MSDVNCVFSAYHEGQRVADILFINHSHAGGVEQVAARIMVLLGAGEIVFLQHNAGDVISGGPVPAKAVTDLLPFDQIAQVTGETEERVRDRLIVFATCPEKAGCEMPIIRLQDVKPEDLRMSDLEIWGLGSEHPLTKILKLAMEASSRK